MVNFEKFTHRKSKSFGKPAITITKNGSININSTAMEQHVGNNNYAVFYYDRENYLIGFKFFLNESPEAYKIRKSRKGKLGYITGIAFLKYYAIPYNETQSFTIEWNDQEDMAIINLRERWKFKEKEPEEEDDVPF